MAEPLKNEVQKVVLLTEVDFNPLGLFKCRLFFSLLTVRLIKTRGHARLARSLLVIRLGDSRNRRGNSGYGMVLSSGWH